MTKKGNKHPRAIFAESIYNEGHSIHVAAKHPGDYHNCKHSICLNYKARAFSMVQEDNKL